MSRGECCLVILLCLLATTIGDEAEGRKLFGGYKITPRYCRPSRKIDLPNPGPNICMFNHECSTREGIVVGACMDGFLFGACCQLPLGTAGELVISEQQHTNHLQNSLDAQTKTTYGPTVDVMSNGVSHITESFMDSAITTAQDNEMVQINGKPEDFGYGGVTHSSAPETVLLNNINNEIDPIDFKIPGYTQTTDRSSTIYDDHTSSYGGTVSPDLIQIAISHSPYLTTSNNFQKPMFRPRPTSPKPEQFDDKYVLVPTITHPTQPNKTQELESIVNIIQLLNDTSTPVPFLSSSRPSTIYLQYTDSKSTVSYPTNTNKYQTKATSRRPPPTPFTITSIVTKSTKPAKTTSKKPPSTSYVFSTSIPQRITSSTKKPPSTSYVFSTTIPPRRTTTQSVRRPTTTRKPTTLKKPTYIYPPSTIRPGSYSSTTTKPTTLKASRPGSVTIKPPSTSYVTGPTPPKRVQTVTSAKPPSTSYVTGPTPPKRVQTVNSHVAGPSYTVVSPTPSYEPPPTVIVFSPGPTGVQQSGRPPLQPTRTPIQPSQEQVTSTPKPKPVTQLTINNIYTAHNNYYSTSEKPSPTVLITPKPPSGIITSGAYRPGFTTEYTTAAEYEIETSANDLINNFPPVRNPNLNISVSVINAEDSVEITTPTFIEDQNLDKKVESFVNKIVLSLQDPFNELKDVVYNTNKTSFTTTSVKPTTTKRGTTTKKPLRTQTTKPTSQKPTTRPGTTRKPSTKRPSTTRRTTSSTTIATTTTRKTKPTRRLTTTPPPPQEEEYADENETEAELDYRRHCGIRPLVKSGRIVGGKGAQFGAWPWQVLVRESTWLGLFTKNKCGGVLISNRFVITAAHCQPGFLASLVAVFGEFDISGDLEDRRPLSKNVKRVIVHRQYDAATFENDLALLELESTVNFDQHIVPICLPRGDEDYTGMMATVTGWGRLKYGGGVPSVLQEVKVPIMENHVCQEMFRTAGHSKIILDSFLCAGYANGQKDSCEGDSGGPLVIQRPDGRWQLAGTVSHGIKCAAPYLPGVYMRTTYYKPWLESITGIH